MPPCCGRPHPAPTAPPQGESPPTSHSLSLLPPDPARTAAGQHTPGSDPGSPSPSDQIAPREPKLDSNRPCSCQPEGRTHSAASSSKGQSPLQLIPHPGRGRSQGDSEFSTDAIASRRPCLSDEQHRAPEYLIYSVQEGRFPVIGGYFTIWPAATRRTDRFSTELPDFICCREVLPQRSNALLQVTQTGRMPRQ